MFSKPLFKQSCKANGMLWLIITLATCIMLAVLVLVMGNTNVSRIQNSLGNAITVNVAEAQLEKQSMNLYYTLNVSLTEHDNNLSDATNLATQSIGGYNLLLSGNDNPTDEEKQTAINTIVQGLATQGQSEETQNLVANMLQIYAFENPSLTSQEIASTVLQRNILNEVYNQALAEGGEQSAQLVSGIMQTGFAQYLNAQGGVDIQTFAFNYIPSAVQNALASTFEEYGLDANEIGEIATKALTNLRAQIYFEYPDQSVAEIDRTEMSTLINSLTESLMDELPADVSNSLTELGDMDIFSLVVGEIFFKIAGILLPMIYIIMTANALISGQVDSGSMAYTLSTPTKRRTVAFTQMCFLMLSLFVMFVCTTIVGVVCLQFVNPDIATINEGKMVLYNLGSFVTLFAIAGICFLTSCIFNRSKNAMATGGGISMYFLVATILGLFGAGSFPSMIRIDAMNIFNYTTIISLFDTTSILAGTTTFIWKYAILIAIGIVCFIVGERVFNKKDLPL